MDKAALCHLCPASEPCLARHNLPFIRDGPGTTQSEHHFITCISLTVNSTNPYSALESITTCYEILHPHICVLNTKLWKDNYQNVNTGLNVTRCPCNVLKWLTPEIQKYIFTHKNLNHGFFKALKIHFVDCSDTCIILFITKHPDSRGPWLIIYI